MQNNKQKQKLNITFEPVSNLSKRKFWMTILSIVCGLIAVSISFFAEKSLIFIIPMVVFAGMGFIIHQKAYKDTLKTNNLAQTALILNLLVVLYILIRIVILIFSFALNRLM